MNTKQRKKKKKKMAIFPGYRKLREDAIFMMSEFYNSYHFRDAENKLEVTLAILNKAHLILKQ